MRNIRIGAIFALLIALSAQLCAASAGFNSAEEASRALYQAVRSNDQAALTRILGADSNAEEERSDREMFVRKYEQMHRLVPADDGSTTLYVGAENWPFPFPLVRDSAGWRFDAKAGMEEVLARRVGACELAAISTSRDLATRKQDKPQSGEVVSQGYYLRRAGRNVVAYPAEYRGTGVMTFVARSDGTVYERDLGPGTAEAARAMRNVDSTSSWQRVE